MRACVCVCIFFVMSPFSLCLFLRVFVRAFMIVCLIVCVLVFVCVCVRVYKICECLRDCVILCFCV